MNFEDKYSHIQLPTIGENIKKFRKAKGMTQKELANKCGMAEITIRQYETGKREPRYEQQEIICEALEISMIALVSGTSDEGDNIMFLAGMQDVLNMAESVNGNTEQLEELIDLKMRLLSNYDILNILGQKKAIEHVEMLAKIPEYRLTSESTIEEEKNRTINRKTEED